jgi:hypothetical protein
MSLTKVSYAMINGDPVNVLDFGAVGDGIANDTAAIKAACATSNSVYFPPGQYVVVLDPTNADDYLGFWDGQFNVNIIGSKAKILDNTVYISNDPFQAIFKFNNCSGVIVEGIEYKGVTLPDPYDGSQIGATFVNLTGTSKQVSVKARITDCRYGLRAGDYHDPAKGGASQIDVDLFCLRVGYPIATYLADAITGVIYAEDAHRACYIAGARGGDLLVRFKNQLGADEICLLTDATTVFRTPGDFNILHVSGGGRGCSDFKLTAIDTFSPTTELASAAIGINLSWGNPETYFKNLDLVFDVRGSDAFSSKVSGFKLLALEPVSLYPNFLRSNNQFCYYQNITVSGTIDRSIQSVIGSSGNEIFVSTFDSVSATGANVSNLVFDNVIYRHGTNITKPQMQIYTQGASGPVVLQNCQLDCRFVFEASATNPAKIVNSKIFNLTRNNKIDISNSEIVTYLPGLFGPNLITQDSIFGSYFSKNQIVSGDIALTGASVSASVILGNTMVVNVTGVVTETITGASGFQVGVTGDLTRYADVTGTAVGTTFNIANYAVGEDFPRFYKALTGLIFTAKTSNFTGGKIQVFVTFQSFNPPSA